MRELCYVLTFSHRCPFLEVSNLTAHFIFSVHDPMVDVRPWNHERCV